MGGIIRFSRPGYSLFSRHSTDNDISYNQQSGGWNTTQSQYQPTALPPAYHVAGKEAYIDRGHAPQPGGFVVPTTGVACPPAV